MSRMGRLFDRFRSSERAVETPTDTSGERWMIVGLGNPGDQYRRSRHNTGFMVVERMAAAGGTSIGKRKFNGSYGELREGGRTLMLVEPQTYYNRSGECVAGMMGYFKIPIERVIVVHDEMDLPAGQLRVKRGGGDAGNRGVRSIAEAVGKEFVRVRVGIGHPEGERDDVDWVLSTYGRDETRAAEEVFARAAEAVRSVMTDGLERAMNRYNQRA